MKYKNVKLQWLKDARQEHAAATVEFFETGRFSAMDDWLDLFGNEMFEIAREYTEAKPEMRKVDVFRVLHLASLEGFFNLEKGTEA
jgi:hypothetical protein